MNKHTSVAICIMLFITMAGIYYKYTFIKPTQPVVQRAAPNPQQKGVRMIRLQDSHTTVHVKQGSPFIVQLGVQNWTIAIKNENIVRRVKDLQETQGIFAAINVGTTTLTAEGRAICKTGEACPQYVIAFTTDIVVER